MDITEDSSNTQSKHRLVTLGSGHEETMNETVAQENHPTLTTGGPG